MKLARLLPLLLAVPTLAWAPSVTPKLAQEVVDSVYSRINPIPTLLQISLQVTDGAFPSGTQVGLLYGTPKTCLDPWLQDPTDYAKYGSRPVEITLAGQANAVALVAAQARNAFQVISGTQALAEAKKMFPDGELQVYVEIHGLAHEFQRAAYNVGIMVQKGQFLHPIKIAYLEDWKKGPSGRWEGTMLYTFDLSKAPIDPQGTLTLVLQTESTANCTYLISANLANFN
jgi:hypothetical protein